MFFHSSNLKSKEFVMTLVGMARHEFRTTPLIGHSWARLGDLANVVALLPSQVLKRFGLLNDLALEGLIEIAVDSRYLQRVDLDQLLGQVQRNELNFDLEKAGDYFIPFHWAEEVVAADKNGFFSVDLISVEREWGIQDGWIKSMTNHQTGKIYMIVGSRDYESTKR